MGDRSTRWSGTGLARAPGGPTTRAGAPAPVRATRATHCRRELAGPAWRARDDRHFGRPGGRCGARRGRIGSGDRDRARARAVLAGRDAPRRARERGRVRAVRRAAAHVRRARCTSVQSGDGLASHAHRCLHRGPGGAGGRADNGKRTTDHAPSRLRPLSPLMIRTLWFYVVLVVSSVIHSTGVILAAVLGVKRRPGGVYDWGTTDWSRQILRAAGTPVEVEGLHRIPDGPVVYTSNHSSMFDIWALAATLPGSVRMVAKQELA